MVRHIGLVNADAVVLIALTDCRCEAGALFRRITELLGETPVLEAVRADGTHYWSHTGETLAQKPRAAQSESFKHSFLKNLPQDE